VRERLLISLCPRNYALFSPAECSEPEFPLRCDSYDGGTVFDGELVTLGPDGPARLRSSAELSLRAERALGFEWAETNTQ
jgi:hypothetical protein